jgi:plastocyanin
MKKVFGLLILILVLVAVSGCTQQAKTTPAATTVQTTVSTPVPATIATTAPMTVVTTVAPAANSTAAVTPGTTAAAANVTATAMATSAVPNATPAVTASMTPSTEVTTIQIMNGTFTPSVLVILPGTGITWKNDDTTLHSVKVIGNNTGMFNSGNIASGGTFIYTFTSTGTFQYADGYNMNSTGTVIVQNANVPIGMVTMAEPLNPY